MRADLSFLHQSEVVPAEETVFMVDVHVKEKLVVVVWFAFFFCALQQQGQQPELQQLPLIISHLETNMMHTGSDSE